MLSQRFLALTLSLALLLTTVQLVRLRKLREEYALLWLVASAANFLLAVFAGRVGFLAALFAASFAPTLILVCGLLFALIIILSQSVIVTRLTDEVRDLAQSIAIMEWNLRQLEDKMANSNDIATNGNGHENGHTSVPGQPPPGRAESEELRTATVAEPARADQTGPSANKVLVIGLDGATFDLIEPWAQQGYLPTLGRIMKEGSMGRLRSTTPPMTGPAWTTFATGTNPGKHGLYDWIARKDGTYRFLPVTALDCKVPTLYQLLSEAGRRVCALNIPMTYPPLPVNGVMVSGLPAPTTDGITYPAGLYDEMLNAIGGEYILYPDPGQAYSDSGVEAFVRRLFRAGELRIRAFEYLRSREPWDFAMLVFNGTDTASHALWKYMDPSHPLHDEAAAQKFGSVIRDYYQYMDSYLGQVIEGLDDDTTLVIMSDHGFGPFHKFVHVNNWLIKSGFMRIKAGPTSRVKAGLFGLGFTPMNVYDTLMRLGLGALKREVVRGQGQSMLKKLFLSFEDVDWSRTQAYSLGNVGQINLNVVGREPFGCVRPGEEYERVRDAIMARVQELRDPVTGEPVVEAVYRREDLYSGDEFERAPDIVFMPRRLEYFGFGEYEFGSNKIIEAMRRGISGTHRMHGVLLAYGQAIRPGVCVEGAGLADLAPTILHIMGEPVPEHMDGRVLDEILVDGFQPVRRARGAADWDASAPRYDGDVMTAEEEQLLAERLRSLGYVG